jgi:precorrin-6A/cobalt-precorrin-6A reductase
MDSHRGNTAGWGLESSASDMKRHILILGGTTEARQLAQHLAARTDITVTLSLAGRTAAPLATAVPVRRGGFGGISGLTQYLRDHEVNALIDATHPYAPTISAHAVSAALQANTPTIALRRPPWLATAGDQWTEVLDADHAVRVLGSKPRQVFLALGRQEIAPFALAPQHRYLIRSVDPVEPPLAVPRARYILARGPFAEETERALLLAHAIEVVVAKNSGGLATYGKIAAARVLGIPVLLFQRPPEPKNHGVTSVEEAIAWLDHVQGTDIERGV